MNYNFKLNNQIYKVGFEQDENTALIEINGEKHGLNTVRLIQT